MVDLSTKYLGLKLKNPLVASASPLTGDIDKLLEMEAAGVGAVVLPSLFAEQISLQDMGAAINHVGDSWYPEELKHIPHMDGYNQGIGGYLAHLYNAKKQLNIPVIASLNTGHRGGWVRYAKILEGVGADALVLNIYYLTAEPQLSSREIEDKYVTLVQDIKAQVSTMKVSVKISPYFSSIAHMMYRLVEAGADGLVLFNRFYQPDFDIDTQTIEPSLDLSTPVELRLRLRWMAMLYGRVQADYALTGGVHSAADVIKCLLAGANVAMITSTLYKHGIDYAATILSELEAWMVAKSYESVTDMRGTLSQQNVSNAALLERANYMAILKNRPAESDA